MSIDVTYIAFDPKKADAAWETFPEQLASRQRSGFDGFHAYEDEFLQILIECLDNGEAEYLPSALVSLDLAYGEVAAASVETGKLEHHFLHALRGVDDPLLTREDLLGIYARITEAYIDETSRWLATEMNWEYKESRNGLVQYLKDMRPVAKSLKEDPSLVFVREVNGGWEDCRQKEFLMQRQEAHMTLLEKTTRRKKTS